LLELVLVREFGAHPIVETHHGDANDDDSHESSRNHLKVFHEVRLSGGNPFVTSTQKLINRIMIGVAYTPSVASGYHTIIVRLHNGGSAAPEPA
jgi:hypothetical protein